jgi:hypothetical protein
LGVLRILIFPHVLLSSVLGLLLTWNLSDHAEFCLLAVFMDSEQFSVQGDYSPVKAGPSFIPQPMAHEWTVFPICLAEELWLQDAFS